MFSKSPALNAFMNEANFFSILWKFKNVILAHKVGNFDHQFFLSNILTETDLTPGLIMCGTNLILKSVGNVKFLDYPN